MRRRYLVLSMLLGMACSACDFVVPSNKVVTLGNGGQIFGSPGSANAPANAAVRVNRDGVLIVEDADVRGGDDGVPKSSFAARSGGDAVSVTGGLVTLVAGTLQGGDAIGRGGLGFGGDGVELSGGTLSVRGGTIRAGRATGDGRLGRSVFAFGATVLVTAGSVDDIELILSTLVIGGGSVGSVFMPPLLLDRPMPLAATALTTVSSGPCIEISGGNVRGPVTLNQSSALIVVGRSFELPFGEVTRPDPIPIVGQLEDGSPISLFAFRGDTLSRVILVDSTSPLLSRPRCFPLVAQ